MTDEQVFSRAARDPVFFGKAFLGWQAHPGQAVWLRGSVFQENYNRSGNRWGKTEAAAIKHLWKNAFKVRDVKYSDSLPYETCNVSITSDQARLAITKAWRIVNDSNRAARAFKKCFIAAKKDTPFPHIIFRAWLGSVFWARSTQKKGDYLQGHDYDYLSYDEAAYDPHLDYVVDEVLTMRLADRAGQLDFISTGRGRNAYYRRFEEARKHPDRHFVYQGSTLDNPHVAQEYVRAKMAGWSQRLIEERVLGGVASGEGILAGLVDGAVERGTGLRGPVPGRRYSTGVDLGRASSKTTIFTLDVTEQPYQLVVFERFGQDDVELGGQTFWEYVYSRIRHRKALYGGFVTIDSTGLGEVVLDAIPDVGAEAVNFAGGRKAEVIGCVELAFSLSAIGIPFIEQIAEDGSRWALVDELEGLDEDSTGAEIDSVVAIGLALWAVRDQLRRNVVRLAPKVAGVRRF